MSTLSISEQVYSFQFYLIVLPSGNSRTTATIPVLTVEEVSGSEYFDVAVSSTLDETEGSHTL